MTTTKPRSVYIGGPAHGEELIHLNHTGPWPEQLVAKTAIYHLDAAASTELRAVYRNPGPGPARP